MLRHRLPYEQFLYYLKKDIEEAIEYLYVDPITKAWNPLSYYRSLYGPGFPGNRVQQRHYPIGISVMNYYAAQSVVCPYPDVGGYPEAKGKPLTVAEDLIEKRLLQLGVWKFRDGQNQRMVETDLLFKTSIFHDGCRKIGRIPDPYSGTRNWFDASSPGNTYQVVYLNQSKAEEIYESPGIGDSDWGFIYCLLPQGQSRSYYGLVKLRQHPEHTADYSRMIPMIRITEMYYIAAECRMEAGPDYDKSKALDYLFEYGPSAPRNRPAEELPASLTDAEVKEVI